MKGKDDMQTILTCAEAFGYGPAGILSGILRHLQDKFILRFIGSGTALELMSRENFLSDVISCQIEDADEINQHKRIFEEADLILGVQTWHPLLYGSKLGKPTVYVDLLFWMWPEINTQLKEVDAYFIENFPGVTTKLEQIGRSIRNPIIVGPLVDSLESTRWLGACDNNETLLVHFGGLEANIIQIGKNTHYPQLMVAMLNQVLDKHQFNQVILVGSKRLAETCAHLLTVPRSSFVSLNHQDFIALMRKASLLITSPGLSTTYEAFGSGIPTLFLPPQNDSHWMILNRLREAGAGQWSVHWSDFYPNSRVTDQDPPEQNIATVLEIIDRACRDSQVLNYMSECYRQMLIEAQNPSAAAQHIERQDAMLEKMGSPGLSAIAQYLYSKLDSA